MARVTATNDAHYLLRQMLLMGGSEVAESHQWLSEIDRWKELVFALLTQTTKLPQPAVRLLTDQMLHLDLLQVPVLAELLDRGQTRPHLLDPRARRIVETLEVGGFSRAEAANGLTVMCAAAAVLSTRFSGKIQLYLRSCGERMVRDAQTIFRFPTLDPEAAHHALTLWFQNVLNMPLSLQDQATESFCKANGVTSRQILDAADELDVNVALVDDLLQHFISVSQLADDETARPGEARRRKASKRVKKAKDKAQLSPKE